MPGEQEHAKLIEKAAIFAYAYPDREVRELVMGLAAALEQESGVREEFDSCIRDVQGALEEHGVQAGGDGHPNPGVHRLADQRDTAIADRDAVRALLCEARRAVHSENDGRYGQLIERIDAALAKTAATPSLPFYIVHAAANGRPGLFVVGTMFPNRQGYQIPDDAKPEDLEAIARYLRARAQQH